MRTLPIQLPLVFTFTLAWTGCGGNSNSAQKHTTAEPIAKPAPKPDIAEEIDPELVAQCPEEPAPELLRGVTLAHRDPQYWFDLLEDKFDLDEELLSTEAIRHLNASFDTPRPGFFPQANLLIPLVQVDMEAKIAERFTWMKSKLNDGQTTREPGPSPFRTPDSVTFRPEFRVALAPVQLYCAPSKIGIFDNNATNKRIDRNRCSNAHPQELIEVVAPWSEGMLLARTATSWGFISANAPLSAPLTAAQATRFASGPYAVVNADTDRDSIALLAHMRLPMPAVGQALFATDTEITTIDLAEISHTKTQRPLTRRTAIAQALSYLGMDYGFGGLDGGIDCSRLMLDVFGTFGIKLPRFSGWQAKAGNFSIDVAGLEDDAKQEVIDSAMESGIVMMQLPGHIMLYLGRDGQNVPMAIHALAYYLDPCDGDADGKKWVGKVQIGDLELGRGTRKTALIERITRITVLGKKPSKALASIATLRSAAAVSRPSARECKQLPSGRLFISPRRPSAGKPVRVVVTTRKNRGPVTMTFYDAKGQRHQPSMAFTDGPPIGYIGTLDNPTAGKWMAVLGDGDDRFSCTTFSVRRGLPKVYPPIKRKYNSTEVNQQEPIWKVRHEWGAMYEDLYATFNERLFDYSESDVTWPNLHTLLRDKDRNILFDYFGQDEENQMSLIPDCADLPYTLRAYFSWKMGLPFGIHDCRRARKNKPPLCVMAEGNLMSRTEFRAGNSVQVFEDFVNFHVRRVVHSSSGRTAPEEELSDFYPVRLSRKSLRPGTLFTDPYGHLLVVVDWVDQGAKGYGALIGADAQPDGTVGRRRFWQGSFLFHPDTSDGGAGFKAFRPWIYEKETETLATIGNEELLRGRVARFSDQQYKGSEARFYDKMEGIINPRPLDPIAKMRSLVDALEEQVTRRRTSVATGEAFMKERNYEPIEMPVGSKIFLTSGPWEDFSTPSRDWRLLIAIHTVVDFPNAVERTPSQYGVDKANAKARSAEVRQALHTELSKRSFPYVRSDGSEWTLTLKDLVDRRVEFEMSYNPNDCSEIRWAAPVGGKERSTCTRHAPIEQAEKMQKYRPWFAERRRPAS